MVTRAPILVPLFIGVLVCACGDDGTPPDAPEGDRTTLDCEPSCGEGFACFDGVCLPACAGGCPAGTTCNLDGTCSGDIDDGLGPDFQRNPCGGSTRLTDRPGDPCGACGDGRWLCNGADSLFCVEPVGTNGCGGCEPLEGDPGTACGEEQRWACVPAGGVVCLPSLRVNPCGGSELLSQPPGRPCGACGDGWYTCDGPNATRCSEPGEPAVTCDCGPGVDPPIACGTDAGRCQRGLRFCQLDGQYGSCVAAGAGATCLSDGDCGDDGHCVLELVDPAERHDDACREAGVGGCIQRRCRSVQGTRGCSGDADCAPTQGCGQGFCHPLAIRPFDELCNGIDDDCDGRIDDDERRGEICGACPFNMRLVLNEARSGERRWLCVDHYEASRPDATAGQAGSVDLYAASRPNVLPWTGLSAQEAVTACSGRRLNDEIGGAVAVKRLCLLDEWTLVCGADRGWPYPYGEAYVAGMCHDGASDEGSPLPTGSIPECSAVPPEGAFPVFDLSGNVAEWVRGDTGAVLVGGDRSDGESALSCLAEPRLAEEVELDDRVGFRCCATPDLSTEVSQ